MTNNEQLIARLVAFTDDWMIGRGYTLSARDGVADLLELATSDNFVPNSFQAYNQAITWLIATELRISPDSTVWPFALRGLLAEMNDLAENAND